MTKPPAEPDVAYAPCVAVSGTMIAHFTTRLEVEADRAGGPHRERLLAVASFIVDSYRHAPELMKVIIVEVTRAANSFGRTHLPEIRQAYEGIAKIVSDGQEAGAFRGDISPLFASMTFYGAIEQLLSGWIFDLIPASDAGFDEAKELLVTTICDGLEPR